MTATQKYLVKCAGVGAYAALVSLQVALPGVTLDDGIQAFIAGAIGALGFAGLAKTPLENPGGEQ